MARKRYVLEVEQVREEPNDMLRVQFKVPTPTQTAFHFKQGQYLTFFASIDDQLVRRSYSICSGVGEPLAVAVKRIEQGQFSGHVHDTWRVGTTVQASAPEGNFHVNLDSEESRRFLLIAAGSGITPILSNVRSILSAEPKSSVTLLYGNKRGVDVAFRDELLWLKNRYMTRLQWINLFSRESQAAPILNGRIDNRKGAELNQRLINLAGFDEFFLCGPQGMISEVSRGLRQLGVDDAHIHYELFFASAEDAQAALEKYQARVRNYAGLQTRVKVRYGGREVEFELNADGENLLDGALKHGLDLPFSCKGGVCATCKARVVAGEVEMDLNHALSDAEVADGYVLTCQAHPISDTAIVDFDVA